MILGARHRLACDNQYRVVTGVFCACCVTANAAGFARYFLPMVSPSANEVIILGVTQDGRPFRPSDWAERLAGVMGQFRPGGAVPGSHLSYSPWCIPNTLDGKKCVIVHTDLREAEPMAWDFVMNFARDNELQVISPERPAGPAA